jgi:hypothetical protein
MTDPLYYLPSREYTQAIKRAMRNGAIAITCSIVGVVSTGQGRIVWLFVGIFSLLVLGFAKVWWTFHKMEQRAEKERRRAWGLS